jgi:hypothetical protein
MNPLLLLFIAEETLRHLPEGKKTTFVKAYQVQRGLKQGIPCLFSNLEYSRVRNAMKYLFPIYKNCRIRTHRFKIRAQDVYECLDKRRIRLKPYRDIILRSQL